MLLLLAVGVFLPAVLAAEGESSFTPDSVLVSIRELGLRNSVSGNVARLYRCESDCIVDIVNEEALSEQLAITETSVSSGTYDQVYTMYCDDGSAGYNASVRGSASVGETTYLTHNNEDPLTTIASEVGYVNVPFEGCATRYSLLNSVTISGEEDVHLNLFVFNRFAAWVNLGPPTMPGGCISTAEESVCMSLPDIVPAIGPNEPIQSVFAISTPTGGMNAIAHMVLLVVDSVTNEVISGMTRRVFTSTSQPLADARFDTPLRTIQSNGDGTLFLESYGGIGADFYVRFPRFELTTHDGNLTVSNNESREYRAFSLGALEGGEECQEGPVTFTHMFTNLTQVKAIVPLGVPSTGGTTKDRHQIQNRLENDVGPEFELVPIFAPANATLHLVRKFSPNPCVYTGCPPGYTYYGIMLGISCEITVIFDHLEQAQEKLQHAAEGLDFTSGQFPPFQQPAIPTSYAAGELIAYTRGSPPNNSGAWDYAVRNESHENIFANMDRYRSTPNLRNELTTICGGALYSNEEPETLQDQFLAKLGFGDASANGDCRSTSRDAIGNLSGNWFNEAVSMDDDRGRLAIATEVTNDVRISISHFTTLFFPLTSNPDPALVAGGDEVCYEENFAEEVVWFRLSEDGNKVDVHQTSDSNCENGPPDEYAETFVR